MTGQQPAVQQADVNAVLAFEDIAGHRWLAGAVVGYLIPEDPADPKLSVPAIMDKGLVLTGLRLVCDE